MNFPLLLLFISCNSYFLLGAIPITFADTSGYIYETGGFDTAKLKTMQKIKAERGARVGRYIIASTTAQFDTTDKIFDIPCDLVFACSQNIKVDEVAITKLSSTGCQGVIECVTQALTGDGISALKKRSLMHGPYRAVTAGASFINGHTINGKNVKDPVAFDNYIKEGMGEVFKEVKSTAKEFNTRGDLNAGASIASFLRVGNVMLTHGAV